MIQEGQALWYVVHTLAGYEHRVAQDMRKMIGTKPYEILLYDVMVPTQRVKEFSRGKVRVKDKRLFPGYVFVKMIKTIETWYEVRNVYAVTGFVGPAGLPTPITEEEADRLMKIQMPVKIDIRVGDRVVFKREEEYEELGFPNGFELIVEKVTDDEHILQFSFMLANKKQTIDCDYDFCMVKKSDAPEEEEEEEQWRPAIMRKY